MKFLLSLNIFFIKNQLDLHANSNIRYAIWSLRSNIESAGYIGCSNIKNSILEGAYKPIDIVKNSAYGDSLKINSTAIKSDDIYKKINNNQIVVNDNFSVHDNDELLMSDCINAEIIYVKKVGVIDKKNQLITSYEEIKNNYDQFSKVYLLNTVNFYVLNHHLYEMLNHRKEDLFENISSIYFNEIKNFLQIKMVFDKKSIIFFVPERALIA